MEDIIKIVKSLKESGFFLFFLEIGVSDTIENKVKEQEGGFLGTLLGTFGAIFFEDLLPSKGVVRGGDAVIRAGERTIRAEQITSSLK